MPAWIKKSFSGFEQRSLADPAAGARFARDDLVAGEAGVSRFSLEPHDLVAMNDPRRAQLEVFVVVGGSGRARLDDDVVELASWDVLRITEGVRRAFEAGPDGMRMLRLGGRDGGARSAGVPRP
jgi:hypothetical protein